MPNVDQFLLRPVWFEIDLDALRHNFLETRRLVGNNVKIICALKCNAYGFGYLEVAEEVVSMGAYGVAVADLFEAIYLRQKGINVPILLYANNLPSQAKAVIDYNLTPTISDFDSAVLYSEQTTLPLKVFVKVDVGLNRIGVFPNETVPFVEKLLTLNNIVVNGIYTHFHFTPDDAYVNWQFKKFEEVLQALERRGLDIPIKLASSTPTILQLPHTYLNAVDPGRLIYGNPAVAQPRQAVLLKPVFRSLKTRIIERKKIYPSQQFQESGPFPVPSEMIIGILPIGWGDGYHRKHSSIGPALVKGKRVLTLNGIHFEHTRIDLTEVPDARIGDEVVLIGKQGDEEISLDEIVKIRDTDLQEVCQSVRNHIPRLYIKDGKPYKLITPLGEVFL
jgi:alanine racemase